MSHSVYWPSLNSRGSYSLSLPVRWVNRNPYVCFLACIEKPRLNRKSNDLLSKKLDLIILITHKRINTKSIVTSSSPPGAASKMAETLRCKLRVEALHSDLSQNRRDAIMDKFRKGHVKVLVVCLYSRGLNSPLSYPAI